MTTPSYPIKEWTNVMFRHFFEEFFSGERENNELLINVKFDLRNLNNSGTLP